MARPCKSAKLLTENSQTKEEIFKRAAAEETLKGSLAVPKPPAYLNKNQKNIYKNIVKMLEKAKILGELDGYLLSVCAVAIDRLQYIEKAFNQRPELMWTNDKLLSAKDKYTKDFFRCCNELSLSPQSRAKLGNLKLQAEAEKADPVLRLLGGGEQ